MIVVIMAQTGDSGGQEDPIGKRPVQNSCNNDPMIKPFIGSPNIHPIKGAQTIGCEIIHCPIEPESRKINPPRADIAISSDIMLSNTLLPIM